MRKIIALFILFASISNTFSQEKVCSNFKTGEFTYVNPQYSDWKVIRTESKQTEINSKTGVEVSATIKWESECKYILTYEKIINSDKKDLWQTSFC